MRKSTLFLLFMAACCAALVALPLHARIAGRAGEGARASGAALARELQLTDLCLFSEARYTRHPAMADLHAAFQDHPGAIDHFPSGSLVSPPRRLPETP